MIKNKRIYGFSLTIGTILAIITLVLTAISLAISLTELCMKLGVSRGSNGGEVISEFKAGLKEKHCNITTNRGTFIFNVKQSNGELNANYNIEYKRVNGRKYYTVSKHNFQENNKYDFVKWGRVSKNINYVFKFIKGNNISTDSTFEFDWLIS